MRVGLLINKRGKNQNSKFLEIEDHDGDENMLNLLCVLCYVANNCILSFSFVMLIFFNVCMKSIVFFLFRSDIYIYI